MKSILFALSVFAQEYVDVAILHSQTGTLAISEITVINAEILAIEELNAAGGVLGKQVRYTIFDGQSDPAAFASNADYITQNSSFATTFGCWTSSSRKAVLPYFESRNKQLWYPVQYEGQECSKNVFYSGADPNEQIEPSLVWLLSNYPKNVYLIGSDYVFPRTANSIIKSMLYDLGATLVGEDYIPLPANASQSASNNASLSTFLDKLLVAAPSGCIIYNTLNGDANVQLFQWMAVKNMTADKYPSMSVSITEAEAPAIGIQNLVGHFAAWNYFMTDPAAIPQTYTDYLSSKFITSYRNRFGNTSVVNDPMEAAYINVKVWAQAVEQAESFDVDLVRNAAYGITFDAPEGIVTLQPNHHFSKYARIGRFRSDGLFDVVYYGSTPVVPNPWNQYITASTGKICDWSQNRTDASQYSPKQVKVGLLYDAKSIENFKAQQLAIERINYGGLLGYMIVPVVINLDWDETTIAQLINDTVAIMGIPLKSVYNQKWSAVTQDLNQQFLALIPRIEGQYTPTNNTLILDLTPSQSLNTTLTWLMRTKYRGYFCIAFNGTEGLQSCSFVDSYFAGNAITKIGSVTLDPFQNNSVLINQMVQSIAASGLTNVLIINTFPGSYAKTTSLIFSSLKSLTIKYKICSTSMNERKVTSEMTTHYGASSYFQQISIAQNAVFYSLYTGRYGSEIVSNGMVMSYAAVNIWAEGVKLANSFDPVKVRVSLYGVPIQTPSGAFTLQYSNRFSAPVRIAVVASTQNSNFYRPVVGGDDSVDTTVDPIQVKEGDVNYFGPQLSPRAPPSMGRKVLTGITVAIHAAMYLAIGWVITQRDSIIIRKSGFIFMLATLFGSTIGISYVYFLYPTNATELQCYTKSWTVNVGFFIVFSTLIEKCFTIFRLNRKRRKATDKQVKSRPLLHVFLFTLAISVAIVAKYFVDYGNGLDTVYVDLQFGVSYEQYYVCKTTYFDYGILFACGLICIVGCTLAVQIREIKLPHNETYYISETIYIWAFVKIIIAVILAFAPPGNEIFYYVEALGEIVPNVHTFVIFVAPKYLAITRNEIPQESGVEDALSGSDKSSKRISQSVGGMSLKRPLSVRVPKVAETASVQKDELQ